ncbi:Holliday junction branch migration protein RuvA [Candidatus Saccharibacteria bacterium]|nr:Holliday junction branch migration protein RuvA [Candidatus Saccharibacteria bacterium]
MIAIISGIIEEQDIDKVIISANGLGYEVYTTSADLSAVAKDDLVKFYIYEHIREQSHDLFGFLNRADKQLFEKLLSVNGVGPKMALAIMNIGSASELKAAIATGQVKFLQSASGVGKKVAERIVVDLKDKLGIISDNDATSFLTDQLGDHLNDETYDALLALGFSSADASRLLANIDSSLATEEKLKLALKRRF